MKFELSLSALLIFIVPGVVTLGGLLLFVPFDTIKDFIDKAYTNDKIDIILALILIIFVLGAIIEMLRPIVIGVLIEMFVKKVLKDKMEDYLSRINKDNLEVFNMLTEQTQVYYKLNSNFLLSTIFLFVSGIFTHQAISCCFYIIVAIIIIIEIIATVKARRDVIYVMNKFKSSN